MNYYFYVFNGCACKTGRTRLNIRIITLSIHSPRPRNVKKAPNWGPFATQKIRITILYQVLRHDGGGGGIRTHGTLAGTTVFETAPIDHSGTPPSGPAPTYRGEGDPGLDAGDPRGKPRSGPRQRDGSRKLAQRPGACKPMCRAGYRAGGAQGAGGKRPAGARAPEKR